MLGHGLANSLVKHRHFNELVACISAFPNRNVKATPISSTHRRSEPQSTGGNPPSAPARSASPIEVEPRGTYIFEGPGSFLHPQGRHLPREGNAMALDDELTTLDKKIAQLRIQFDLFF